MKVAVAAEVEAGEPRVAATPETIKKIIALGAEVAVEPGAGIKSGILDADYSAAGAKIVAADALNGADIILKVRRPQAAELSRYKTRRDRHRHHGSLRPRRRAARHGRRRPTSPSPWSSCRASRARRSMDVLSSQANLAGYRAVIDAAAEYGRALPMMMTAAGTVPATKVFVMGAGVAGLQAIATARRLGAVVTATDVRPAAKEQVESLGAKFVAVEDEEFKAAETAGGYAKEMSKEYQAKQAALVADHIKKQDIVITTALIPGRPAPRLISKEMVASMRPGSVIVDLAVERGGNVEGVKADAVTETGGVKIVGYGNVPGRHRRHGVKPLCEEFARLPGRADRQEDQGAGDQLGRRNRESDRAHARRRGRASEFQAEERGVSFPSPLVGRVRGGGREVMNRHRGKRVASRPPSPPSPTRREGDHGRSRLW